MLFSMYDAAAIIGLVLIVVGVGLVIAALFRKPKETTVVRAENVVGDAAKLLEELRKLLELFEKRFQLGVLLLLVGVALVALATYGEISAADLPSGTTPATTP